MKENDINYCSYGCGKEGIIKNKSNSGHRCSNSPNSCPAVKARKRENFLKTYGVENPSQLQAIQDKKKATWIEKYGVDNPAKATVIRNKIKDKWPEIGRKRKETMLKKYGVDSYCKTIEFQERRKATWIEKYGVDNPTKNSDILHKAMVSNAKSAYRTKTLVLPSGKKIRYQGFEDRVILELLKAGLLESDIITGPGNVPRIEYSFDNTIHMYYPDIYVPRFNQLIEVKSTYTWRKYKDKNLAKRQATIDAGFNYNVVIRRS